MSITPLFAPAHELSRQIQIINAYCREAEVLDDPLQDTLWHLLDELIEVIYDYLLQTVMISYVFFTCT